MYICILIRESQIEDSNGTGAQACDCKCYRLWVRFSVEEMNYLIFLFLRSGIEAKRGGVFRRSTRNT